MELGFGLTDSSPGRKMTADGGLTPNGLSHEPW